MPITSLSTLKGAKVLIVDDQPLNIVILKGSLDPQYEILTASSGEEALHIAHNVDLDLVLLDVVLGGISGIDVCRQMKSDEQLQEIPVLFVTSLESNSDEATCWEAGAADFLIKPVNAITLHHRVKAQLTLKRQRDVLKKLVYIDGLTGVYNRRYFYEQLQIYYRQQQRDGSPLSLLMIDVDHFKAYNDKFGHLAGDDCLRQVARVLKEEARRPQDFVARYGGEEFAVLLSNTDALGARQMAQSILLAVNQSACPSAASENCHSSSDESCSVTVSIGVATRDASNPMSYRDMVMQADQALYQAKNTGRNRFAIAQDIPLHPVD